MTMVKTQLLYTSILYLLILHQDVCSQADPTSIDDKIVGGEEIDITQQPSQVYVLSTRGNLDYQCGGAIIHSTHIVTAAHCVYNASSVRVRIGIADLDASLKDHPFISATYKVHEKYVRGYNDYDLALIKVEKKFTYGPTIKRIDLAPLNTVVKKKLEVIATGWGYTTNNGPTSRKLRSVKLKVVDHDYCKSAYYAFLTDRMICAGIPKKSACRGDSGGPLVVASDGTLIGLSSFVRYCDSTPAGYVNLVDKDYREWLNNNISG